MIIDYAEVKKQIVAGEIYEKKRKAIESGEYVPSPKAGYFNHLCKRRRTDAKKKQFFNPHFTTKSKKVILAIQKRLKRPVIDFKRFGGTEM